VWYMGEDSKEYENGVVVGTAGSWEAGKDVAGLGVVARPGYQMKASPTPGDKYHQEYYKGEAEDMGEVVAVDVAVALGDGTSYTCLQTRDFTSLDPDVSEYKYYATGIGVVLEEVVDGDERVELISVSAQ
ncbi:MAG: hypothetical protein KJ749_13680, partial [Planctomycetes bacterium]|nr:hypothetical protein [Planctomycetota bacterium]